MINYGKATRMRHINWKRGAALLIACALGLTPVCAGADLAGEMPLTAGVFFLLAQETVELPVGSAGISLETAKLSADLLNLCSEESFGGKDQADVRQLAKKALDYLTDAEKDMFMYNFEDQIVPFCEGLLAGDERCLSLLRDAGVAVSASWTEDGQSEESDLSRWRILKAAVLSLQ